MNIDEMTLEQLKALAYDYIIKLESFKSDLQVINSRIEKMGKEEQEVKNKSKVKSIAS